ncbi:tyrosine-type recombinase/integrase [Pseudomonas oryzihabitans]|uniref:tyrosine-type recombinase/integrase n=1 Tax=Pseudomonas oryzihabitans TaxID=47885 RepID=UPI00241E55B0|nr:tyrosine-type recombinase/integrase [Pseudomonas oryzihabitans]
MSTHLVRKAGESTWYVRLNVPADVRAAFGGRTKLIQTLKTADKAVAMERRLPVLAQWKSEIRLAREGMAAGKVGWQGEVAADALVHRERVDGALIRAMRNPTQQSRPSRTNELAESMASLEAQKLAIIAELEAAGMSSTAKHLKENFGYVPTSPADAVMVADDITQRFAVEQAQKKYGLTPTETREAVNLRLDPSAYKPVSPLTPKRLEAFRAFREAAGLPAKTIDGQQSKLKKLSSYLSTEGVPLTHEVVGAWLESLGLSSKTKVQYLLAGSTFWKWSMKNDALWQKDYSGVANPFIDHEMPVLRGRAKVESKRLPFSTEDVERVYAQARSEGLDVLADLIQISAQTGLRIEEACQLRTESIITVEGIPCFDIADSKTAAGIRQVPIHPNLLPVIERLSQASTDGYLIASSGGNKYGIRSDSLSKAFGRLKTSMCFGSRHVFHSLRMSAITRMLRADVPGPTVADIAGHETGLVTFDVYHGGASPQQKLEAIQHLAYNFA